MEETHKNRKVTKYILHIKVDRKSDIQGFKPRKLTLPDMDEALKVIRDFREAFGEGLIYYIEYKPLVP